MFNQFLPTWGKHKYAWEPLELCLCIYVCLGLCIYVYLCICVFMCLFIYGHVHKFMTEYGDFLREFQIFIPNTAHLSNMVLSA